MEQLPFFLYGTLMSTQEMGEKLLPHFKSATVERTVWTFPAYVDIGIYNSLFPALFYSPEKAEFISVDGELVSFKDNDEASQFASIADRIEGCQRGFYQRTLFRCHDGPKLMQTYMLSPHYSAFAAADGHLHPFHKNPNSLSLSWAQQPESLQV